MMYATDRKTNRAQPGSRTTAARIEPSIFGTCNDPATVSQKFKSSFTVNHHSLLPTVLLFISIAVFFFNSLFSIFVLVFTQTFVTVKSLVAFQNWLSSLQPQLIDRHSGSRASKGSAHTMLCIPSMILVVIRSTGRIVS